MGLLWQERGGKGWEVKWKQRGKEREEEGDMGGERRHRVVE